MRAVINTRDGIRVVDADEPGGAGVRLSVAAVGICGTDVGFAAAGITGFFYGHEFAGVDDNGTGYFVWCSMRRAPSRAWPGLRRRPGREAGSSPWACTRPRCRFRTW